MNQAYPYWPIDPSLSAGPWFNFQVDLLRAALAILPAACFWGASFPLALAAVASPGQDPGRMVGGVYAANTVGAIAGALLFSLLIISGGTQNAQRWLMAIAAGAALLMLSWRSPAGQPAASGGPADRRRDRRPAGRDRGRRDGGARAAGSHRVRPADRVADVAGRQLSVRGRGTQLVGGRIGVRGRRPQLSRERQGRGVERGARHAAPAAARPHVRADASRPEVPS